MPPQAVSMGLMPGRMPETRGGFRLERGFHGCGCVGTGRVTANGTCHRIPELSVIRGPTRILV